MNDFFIIFVAVVFLFLLRVNQCKVSRFSFMEFTDCFANYTFFLVTLFLLFSFPNCQNLFVTDNVIVGEHIPTGKSLCCINHPSNRSSFLVALTQIISHSFFFYNILKNVNRKFSSKAFIKVNIIQINPW